MGTVLGAQRASLSVPHATDEAILGVHVRNATGTHGYQGLP